MSWLRMARWLCGGLDLDRRLEMLGHLFDAEAAGAPAGATETGSIFVMAIRSQLMMILAGVPIMVVCLAAYWGVYQEHFSPWSVMEGTPSPVATLRRAVDLAWVAVIPLGLYSGWRVALRLRRGSFVLPGVLFFSLIWMITQADLFIERNAWFGSTSAAPFVDELPGYSLGLMSMVILIPLTFLVIDTGTNSPTPNRYRLRPPVIEGGRDLDRLALLAIATPCLMFVFPHVWIIPLLTLTWLAPSFSRILKVGVSMAAISPFVAAFAYLRITGVDGIDDLPLGIFIGTMVIELAVWAWMLRSVIAQLLTNRKQNYARSQ